MLHIYLGDLLKHKFQGSISVISALLGQVRVLGIFISDRFLGAAAAGTNSTLRTTVHGWSCFTIWGRNKDFPQTYHVPFLTIWPCLDSMISPNQESKPMIIFYVSIPKFFLNHAYMKSLNTPTFLKQLETLSALNVHRLKSSLWELTSSQGASWLSWSIGWAAWFTGAWHLLMAFPALCHLTLMPRLSLERNSLGRG